MFEELDQHADGALDVYDLWPFIKYFLENYCDMTVRVRVRIRGQG